MKKKLIALLVKNPRMPNKDLAKILGTSEKNIETEIQKLLKSGEIIGFNTVLNTNLNNSDEVTAMVEVRVITKRGSGFDDVAKRVARFPEVVNAYLISGSHDLNLLVKAKSLNDVAAFVGNKVATLDNVLGTTTHFLLKKYKEDGFAFGEEVEDKRLKVSA